MARWSLGILSALLLAACGPSEVGETCDESGNPDECEEGSICTNERGEGEPVCRKTCDDQTDCEDGEACNGVSGTDTKSCQPEK